MPAEISRRRLFSFRSGDSSRRKRKRSGERVGVLIEVRAETDFVVKSDPFQELAHELAMQIAAMDPENVQALLDQPYVRDPGKTVEALVKGTIAKVGENITIERFCRYEV